MKILTILFSAFIYLFTFGLNFSYSNQSRNNDDIIKEIENILLFSDEEKERINLLKDDQNKEDEFVIERGENQISQSSLVNFDVKDSKNKVFNLDVKKKEKIAYNSYISGQYEVAIEFYKQILEEDPDNDYAKYSMAIIYQKMKQFSQAKILYRDLLTRDNEYKKQIIANMLAIMSEESPRGAIYLLSRLSVQNPDSAYLKAQSGLVYEKIEDYDQAILNFKEASKIDPTRVDYKYNLAIIYDKNKNYKEAIETYYDVVKNYNSDKKWEKIIPIEQVQDRLNQLKTMI